LSQAGEGPAMSKRSRHNINTDELGRRAVVPLPGSELNEFP